MVTGNFENLALRVVEQWLDILLIIVATTRQGVAGQNQTPQQILLPNNIDVIPGIGRCGYEIVQLIEKFGSANFFQEAAVLQALLHCDEVNRLTLIAEFDHQFIDDLMSRSIKSVRLQLKNADAADFSW